MLSSNRWRSRLMRIESLLSAERRLLRAGRIEELVGLTRDRARVADWLAELPESGPPQYRQDLDRLRSRAQQNARLLRAYIEGARSALNTVTTLEEEQASLGAYTRDGSRIEAPRTSTRARTRA